MEISLKKMTIAEKLKLMEEIWSDLIQQEQHIPSPFWHKSVLEKREERLKNNEENILDWDDAKDKILRSIK